MPDRISDYRFARLTLHPSGTAEDFEWSLLTGVVKKGIPYAHLQSYGHAEAQSALAAEIELWAAIERLAQSKSTR